MRLAWLAAYRPWPADFGGAIRVFNLIRQAARRHEVTLFALGDPAAPVPEALAEVCKGGVHLQPPDHDRRSAQVRALLSGRCSYQAMYASRRLDAALAKAGGRFDAVVVDSTQMSWHAVPPGLPRILTLHNIEHELLERSAATSADRLRRWFRALDARRLRPAELAAIRSAAQVWTCSERETDLLGRLVPGAQVRTVPNGVDPQSLSPGEAGLDVPDLVFLATMHYDPNADAACWFIREVWPRLRAVHPGLRLGLVGGRPPERLLALAGAGVSLHPMVPSVLPYYRGARLSVVPLLSGGGTRIKILEAAAVGTPQVSTPIGAEGLELRHGDHLLLAEGAEAFADACLAVLADPASARRRAEAARELVLRRYAWDAVGNGMLASLDECLPGRLGGKHG